MSQLDLPLFPAARRTDPETSQANRDASVRKVGQRDTLLLTYARERHASDQMMGQWSRTDGGLTDEEAGMRTPWAGSTMFDQRVCYWKRCSELRKLGYIQPTGTNRLSSFDQAQQVCEITDEGMAHLRSLRLW